MNHSTFTPPPGNLEAFTPFQLHSQLEEARHLLNVAYFTLESADGNTVRLEAGIYAAGYYVASKLDDLTFHYERLIEQSDKQRGAA